MALRNAPGESECNDCCECPPPILRTAVRSKSKQKSGFSEWIGHESTPPKIYSGVTLSGTSHYSLWSGNACDSTPNYEEINEYSGSGLISRDGSFSTVSTSLAETQTIKNNGVVVDVDSVSGYSPLGESIGSKTYATPGPWDGCGTVSYTATRRMWTGTDKVCEAGTGSHCVTSQLAELTDEFTTALLITDVLDSIASTAYGAWSGSSVVTGAVLTYFVISEDEQTASAYQEKYRFRHNVSRMGTGCYRVLWDQVYIPKCGRGIASVESIEPLGGYTPGEAIAVVVPDPSAVCVTNSPTTITATANAEGILEFAVTVAGMGYLADVTATVDGHDLLVHLEGAAAEEYQFPGDVPEGYDPLDPETWPESPVVEPALPEGETAETVGAVYVMNIRGTCRGCV